jgi:hypothetical protein
MRIFRLDPIEERLDDPAWKASNIREGCWVLARDENDARLQAQFITKQYVEREEGRDTPYSPWLDAKLTTCVEARGSKFVKAFWSQPAGKLYHRKPCPTLCAKIEIRSRAPGVPSCRAF